MKISNIIVSNENLNNLTATVSFDISETTKKVDVLIKINGGEFRQALTNQTAENIVYNIKNDLQLGINYVNIKLAHENEEYVSETFLIKLKSNPIIEGFSCPYSDSKGKFELNFTLRGDELFVYRIDLKLDDNEYQEIMSCQVQGEKKYVATSTVGNHTCKLRLYDGYDIYETESFSFEITNQKPILSNVLVTGMLNNGKASIHYAVKDIENSELTHTLTIDGKNTKINPTKVDKFCSYDISGLSVGKHNCYISISDGIDTVMSEVFEIEIFISTTNKKTILQQAKARYDRAYRSLKDIILSVVSDGIFDYDVENAIIQKAQEYYTETYSEFNKIAQQSIDIIGSNKNEMTKRDLESQLGDVDRAISSLEDTMGTTFRDGILTDTEKDILRNNLDLVAKEKSDIDRDYETLYNNADLVDPTKTKLLNAYNEFINAHNNLVLDVDRIINKTGIIDDNDKDGLSSLFEVWRGALGNYRVASLESIDSIAKKRVDDSADVLTKRWSDLQVDLDGIKLEVGSLEERVENVVVNVDTSVQTVQIMYYLSESVTELKGGTWLDVAPTWEQGKYMWSKTVTHLTNGKKTETKPVCIAGAKGQDGINAIQYYTWVRYSSNEDGSNMTSEPNEDTVYIGIAVNKTSKTPSENKEDYSWSKFMGDDGVDGTNGKDGKDGKDGSTTYTWIKYADDSNGNGLSNDPTNKEYIGFAYNKLTSTESTNPSDYKWSLIKGTDGINAIQYYTWVRYSNSSDGSNMTSEPNADTVYIGIAVNKTSKTPSTNKSDYTWSKFMGDDGVNGTNGKDGVTTYTWIKYADNANGSGLSDNPTNKTYIGFAYNKTTATESTSASDYKWSLIKGADGINAIQYYTWVRYSSNADGSDMTSEPNEDTIYIGIAVNKTSSTPSTNKSDYTWSKFRGADGVKGNDGKDGVTTYTWIKYADNASGSGLSDNPTNKTYIGFAYNKTTPTESTNASDYTWSLIKGANGKDAIQYYTWVRYSNVSDGSNMYATPNNNTLYIGIAVNKTSSTPSTNKSDYTWSKFRGADGVKGEDGTTTYTWIKYADSANGSGLSDNPTNKTYIGFAYNKTTPTESTNASDYTWSLIKGADGKDATQYYTWVKYSDNADGTGLYDTPKDSTLYIGIAVNKTSKTESTNKSDYIWSKFRGADGVKGNDGIDGANGKDGVTTYTWIKYADNSNGSGLSDNPTNKTYIGFAYNKTTATESTNPSDYTWSLIKGSDGKDATQYYTWVKYSDNADGTGLYDTPKDSTLYIGIAVNKTSKTESTNKSDYTWSKFKGSDGVKGKDGVNGTTTYTWIKYADNASGSGLSDSPIGKTYIGFAYNKTTATESTNASDYAWSLIKGADGVNGVDGADGVGVKNIVELYYLSTSKTTQTGGSWVTTCPKWVEGKYLWTRTKVEYTDGTIKYTDPLCDTSWEKTNELNTNVQTITKKVSDVEVKTDSITSTVSTMQTSVTNLGTRVTNAETKVTQLSNKITSSVTEDDVKSIIEQSPTEIKYGFNDISDYVTISSSGLTVNRGSVACDLLCTPSGHDPIIKLFGSDGNCAIDATKRYNTGWGTAIRLKWDDYNYYYISDNVATIYQYGYESFMFQTDPTYRDKSRIATPNGTLVFDGSNTYDIYDSENKRLIYDGNQVVLQRSKFVETASVGGGGSYYAKDRPGAGLCFSGGTMVGIYAGKTSSSTATAMFSLFWDTDANPVIKAVHTSKNLTFGVSGLYYAGGLVLTSSNYTGYCAKASHSHSNYASSSHTHNYASSSHTHNYASSSHTHNYASSSHSHSNYMPTKSSKTFWSGSHSPHSSLTYNLGWSQERWAQIASRDVYADYCSTSDINFKENIRYLKSDNVSLFSSDEEEDLLKPNEETNINLGITSNDLYEFTKNELRLCEYNYTDDYSRNSETGEVVRTNFENKLGFIAQDIQNTKVGSLIVGEWEGQLSYNLNNYVSVLGGALQYEITIRDAQIESLESTISDLEERIKELENKLK